MATRDDQFRTLRSNDAPDGPDETSSLWLVSFSEDDDRELRPKEIAEALARGEIDAETIVWRDGQADWLPIASVPSLAKLLPSTGQTRNAPSVVTGGFLGTGLPLTRPQSPPRATRKSEPPPVPLRRRRRASVPPPVPRRGSRKSVPPVPRPGILAGGADDEPMPISVEPESLNPPPGPDAPQPSPTLPLARALSAGTLEIPEESGEEAVPSSGTPSLGALATTSPRDARPFGPRVEDGAKASDLELLAPPTIDLTDVDADAPVKMEEFREELHNTDRASGPAVPTTKTSEDRPATGERAEKKGSPLAWVLLAAAALGAIWLLARPEASGVATEKAQAPEITEPSRALSPAPAEPAEPAAPEEAPRVEAEPEPPEPPSPPEPDEPEKHAPTVARPREPVAQEGRPRQAPEPTPAPAAKPATPPKDTAATATTPPAESRKDKKEVALAGPFDKAAAAAALQNAAAQASACRQEGDPSGRALIRVTFAESGRAVRAVVEGPPFAGTRTGGCIASTMRRATVPPFGGDRITVSKTVIIQ